MHIVRLIKDWTLPFAMGVGTVVYLLFAFTPQLDQLGRFFSPVMAAVLPMLMFLVLFITFCKVDFRQLRPVAWHLWTGLFQVLLIAVLIAAILFGVSSRQEVVLLEAVLMCIISPCATAAAVVTQKLGGNLEQTTTYTFLSNFITVLLVPVCFPAIEPSAHMAFWPAFLKILYEVFIVLIVPMLLAYVVKHWMPRLHRRIISVRDLSYYLWACTLMIVTGTTVRNIVHAETTVRLLTAIAVTALLVCIFQFAVGRYIGRYFQHAQEAGQALGQKNTAMGIWMSNTYLQPLSSVFLAFYIIWQNLFNSLQLWWHDRRR